MKSDKVILHIVKLSKKMTFKQFDQMMQNNGRKTSAFGGMPVYVFGSNMIGQCVVEDIFSDPFRYKEL